MITHSPALFYGKRIGTTGKNRRRNKKKISEQESDEYGNTPSLKAALVHGASSAKRDY